MAMDKFTIDLKKLIFFYFHGFDRKLILNRTHWWQAWKAESWEAILFSLFSFCSPAKVIIIVVDRSNLEPYG